jgi:hypothetical protein
MSNETSPSVISGYIDFAAEGWWNGFQTCFHARRTFNLQSQHIICRMGFIEYETCLRLGIIFRVPPVFQLNLFHKKSRNADLQIISRPRTY